MAPCRYPYFGIVAEIVWSDDPDSYTGGSVAPGRVPHARQVKGDDPDKKRIPQPSKLGSWAWGWQLHPQKSTVLKPHDKPQITERNIAWWWLWQRQPDITCGMWNIRSVYWVGRASDQKGGTWYSTESPAAKNSQQKKGMKTQKRWEDGVTDGAITLLGTRAGRTKATDRHSWKRHIQKATAQSGL
jgi:hypothetical protein